MVQLISPVKIDEPSDKNRSKEIPRSPNLSLQKPAELDPDYNRRKSDPTKAIPALAIPVNEEVKEVEPPVVLPKPKDGGGKVDQVSRKAIKIEVPKLKLKPVKPKEDSPQIREVIDLDKVGSTQQFEIVSIDHLKALIKRDNSEKFYQVELPLVTVGILRALATETRICHLHLNLYEDQKFTDNHSRLLGELVENQICLRRFELISGNIPLNPKLTKTIGYDDIQIDVDDDLMKSIADALASNTTIESVKFMLEFTEVGDKGIMAILDCLKNKKLKRFCLEISKILSSAK